MPRIPIDLNASIIRSLMPTDLELLEVEGSTKAPPLKRLGERHHALARCLAEGKQPWEAAITCSYSPSRVSILQADPTFANLVEYYRSNIDAEFYDPYKKLASITSDAMDILADRMEDAPEKMRTDQLIELSKMGLDRTGHGPTSTNLSVQVDMAAQMALARKRADKFRAERDIEVEHRTIEGRTNDDD